MKKLTLGHKNRGFTLIEIVMVIAVIGTLAAITYSIAVPDWRNRTYYNKALGETSAMGNALKLYVAKNNDYPPEVSRNIPADIKEFMSKDNISADWPDAPWPGSVYDYDNWPEDNGLGTTQTYQISIRFCEAGDTNTCRTNAQKYLKKYVDASVLNSWDSNSSAYYCVKGSCRSAQSVPTSHPGYCLNCSGKSQVY